MWETKLDDEIMAKTPKARDANIARMILYKTTILPPSTTPRSNAIFPIQPVLGKPSPNQQNLMTLMAIRKSCGRTVFLITPTTSPAENLQ